MKVNFRVLLAMKEQDEKRNISLRTIASETGVPLHTIRMFYKGEPKAINPEHIENLCAYFGCGLEDLLELETSGNDMPALAA
jgi:DNA-binding Xre family transcriptional regulator